MPDLGKAFNGVFYSSAEGQDGVYTHSVLRFYEDGTVLWTQFPDPNRFDSIWAQVNEWFNRDSGDERVGKGSYKSDGKLMAFKVDNQITYGTMDYAGGYDGKKMELIRDSKHFESYLPLFPPSRAGAASNDPLSIQKQLDERRKRLLGEQSETAGADTADETTT